MATDLCGAQGVVSFLFECLDFVCLIFVFVASVCGCFAFGVGKMTMDCMPNHLSPKKCSDRKAKPRDRFSQIKSILIQKKENI